MQIHLSPRHLKLTAAIHRHTADKVLQLEELCDEIVAAHVVLIHDETARADDRFTVKVHLAIPGPDIHAEETGAVLFAAIDLVMDKLARQLRKRKTRLTDKVRSKVQKAVQRSRTGGA